MGSKQNEKTAAIVAADRKAEIDVRVQDHARERIVKTAGERFVVGAVLNPDGVEVNVLGEGSEQRKDVDDLGGVGRELESRLIVGARAGGGLR